MLRDGFGRPDAAHYRQRVAIGLPRQIRTDRLRRVAAIVAAEQPARAEVETRRAVRADDERCLPIEAQRRFAAVLDGPNLHALAGAAIEPDHAAVLRLAVDDVRIAGIDARHEAVAA